MAQRTHANPQAAPLVAFERELLAAFVYIASHPGEGARCAEGKNIPEAMLPRAASGMVVEGALCDSVYPVPRSVGKTQS